MKSASLTDQAIENRCLANRVRRLAGVLTDADDAARLLRYADELEDEAVDLERRAKAG